MDEPTVRPATPVNCTPVPLVLGTEARRQDIPLMTNRRPAAGDGGHQAISCLGDIQGKAAVPTDRAPSGGELAGLLDTCEQDPLGLRNAANLSLLYGCGLRRAELVDLQLGDYIKEENELIMRGKDNTQRAIPVGDAAPALADWLAIRGEEAGRSSGVRATAIAAAG